MTTAIWQLRTPEDQTVRDLVTDLAQAISESLEREIDFCEHDMEGYRAFEEPVFNALLPYVKRNNTCGKNIVCTTGIESNSCPDFDDNIYILHLPKGIDGLIDDVVETALESYWFELDSEALAGLERRSKARVRRILITHLYRNPLCGNHDICMISSPVDPWTTGTTRPWR